MSKSLALLITLWIALTAAEGNQSQAAKRLGVHRNTLARWLRDEGD